MQGPAKPREAACGAGQGKFKAGAPRSLEGMTRGLWDARAG